MAGSSSSASSSSSPKKYDVFISFRGEDTRTNFTSHLHDALCRNQIETYIDYRIEKGDEVWPALEKAIEDSTLFLVIFSENYGSSTWCLKELTKILECTKDQGHLVMPVFYKIEPSHVRKQSGSYQQAFEEYEQNDNINKQQVHKWREALTHASNLAGWDSSIYRNEVEIIGEIVNCVSGKLEFMYQNEGDLRNLIGIHEKIADVESLLYKGSPQDVRFIGIWGMGGIGKTTLAKVVFNKLCFAYEGFCFLANVREESKKHGIASLKKKIILTLLGDKESHISMPDGLPPYDIRRLGRQRSLIVLDDVDDQEQIENLAGRHDWFGSGSKIVITTRNKHVVEKEVDDIYMLKALNFAEAFHLFSLNAFKSVCSDMELGELAKEVVYYANGIPLALKVLGGFLYGKSKDEWKSQLDKLKKMPFPKIHDVLKLSFEGLDYEEKNIFLDIACFFIGKKIKYITNLLDACGYSTIIGLKTLEDKALLNIYDGEVFMHDLIEQMGQEIIRDKSLKNPGKYSRLWDPKDIIEVLENNLGSEAIEGISLNFSEIEETNLSPQVFCSMPNLKFLDFYTYEQVNKIHFPDGIEFLPNKLRLLRWKEYPLNSLPETFKAENLVTIEMPDSNLTKLWNGHQNLVNLRQIDLSGSQNLIELPNFSKATHLERVNLSYCSRLCSIHPSIFSLHRLKGLFLVWCRALTSLPNGTHLKSPIYLNLSGCLRLKNFSAISKTTLWLKLSRTAINGNESSLSSGRHNKMDTLNLSLIFYRSRALQILYLDDCSRLFKLPNNISLLKSLSYLSLMGTNVETLPVSIRHLSRLRSLWLCRCKMLRQIPELPPSILELYANDCTSLETLQLTVSTIKDKEDDEEILFPTFVFTNCMELDQQSIKVVEAKALLEMNKAIYSIAELVYPGKNVPEWFVYRTTQSSIIVDLFSITQPGDWSFIFCAVVSKSPPTTYIEIKWFIDGLYVDSSDRFFESDECTFSDHVFLWYDPHLSSRVQSIIEKRKTDYQSCSYNPLLELKFIVSSDSSDHKKVGEIKECGLCLTFAPEFQNYVEQMELALQPQPNSIGMDVGCSYRSTHHKEVVSKKRKYHSFNEFEEMISSFKALKLNDLPTATW